MADVSLGFLSVPCSAVAVREAPLAESDLEPFRRELTGYCYRMLGSGFEAEDAVQEAMLRAWRNAAGFEGRSTVRSWLCRIATNVCIDMQRHVQRRARPMELGPASPPVESLLGPIMPEATWVTPISDGRVAPEEADPAEILQYRESIRLAFVTALQHLPARQRAALILCEVLSWQVAEVAELLDTSVPAVNSALQRARTTLRALPSEPQPQALDGADVELLEHYVDAFERYDNRATGEAAARGRRSVDAAVRHVDLGRGQHRPLDGPAGAERMPGLAPRARLGQRQHGFWAVPAGPDRRVCAMGAAGARDIRREDHRDEFLPGPLGTLRLFPEFGLPLHLET
jgi:RNA polymerase sigma factor (sigma-70 family)